MGWREVIAEHVATTKHPATGELMVGRGAMKRAVAIHAALLDMPPADRIALARELLAGTGRVVAEPIDRRHTTTPVDGYNAGWNAARAAMLGDEG